MVAVTHILSNISFYSKISVLHSLIIVESILLFYDSSMELFMVHQLLIYGLKDNLIQIRY